MGSASRARPDGDLRNALALAIVSQKRRQSHELQGMRAKIARVEAALQEEQRTSAELRGAASRLAQQQQGRPQPGAHYGDSRSWLPALRGADVSDDAPNDAGIDAAPLAAQLAAAAAAHGGGLAPEARAVLASKASTLSGMLLANVRLIRLLRPGGKPGGIGGSSGMLGSEVGGGLPLSAGHAALGPAAEVAEFVAGTLLRTPLTSLSRAYFRESAVALAACLAGGGAAGGGSVIEAGANGAVPAAHQLVAVLLEAAVPTLAPQPPQAAELPAPAAPAAADPTLASAPQARCALATLAALPQTGAVLLAGCAAHLRRLCDALAVAQSALADSWWAASSCAGIGADSGGGSGSREAAALEELLARPAVLFESSHEPLELWRVLCTEHLPAWAPALSFPAPQQPGGGLLQASLAGAADELLAAHARLPELADAFPLLAAGLCDAAGALAAALQHVAAAPGLCVGEGGPALRAACVRQCVRLRDAFMPPPPPAAAEG
ncbi:hypothetical protein Rsub_04980 [Raphidocelis subcapitata]|uniref:Uncharacterized protein n=1 Tax=Raphidocelis subcapitata TaxID=307507 RepID=A0A2V0P465_9CHLO|nr:hypothetical protein Rsub_04980 [Raphidocelis subcapitata]|eukprot:GBF91875.1 hypothetical protein Rsub_04980 [Raphidocelis subcapitata]